MYCSGVGRYQFLFTFGYPGTKDFFLNEEYGRRSVAGDKREMLFKRLNVRPEGACEPGCRDSLLSRQLWKTKTRPAFT